MEQLQKLEAEYAVQAAKREAATTPEEYKVASDEMIRINERASTLTNYLLSKRS